MGREQSVDSPERTLHCAPAGGLISGLLSESYFSDVFEVSSQRQHLLTVLLRQFVAAGRGTGGFLAEFKVSGRIARSIMQESARLSIRRQQRLHMTPQCFTVNADGSQKLRAFAGRQLPGLEADIFGISIHAGDS